VHFIQRLTATVLRVSKRENCLESRFHLTQVPALISLALMLTFALLVQALPLASKTQVTHMVLAILAFPPIILDLLTRDSTVVIPDLLLTEFLPPAEWVRG
jgi:hypothetical protein